MSGTKVAFADMISPAIDSSERKSLRPLGIARLAGTKIPSHTQGKKKPQLPDNVFIAESHEPAGKEKMSRTLPICKLSGRRGGR